MTAYDRDRCPRCFMPVDYWPDEDVWGVGPGPSDAQLEEARQAGEWMSRNTTSHALDCPGWPCKGNCGPERPEEE